MSECVCVCVCGWVPLGDCGPPGGPLNEDAMLGIEFRSSTDCCRSREQRMIEFESA